MTVESEDKIWEVFHCIDESVFRRAKTIAQMQTQNFLIHKKKLRPQQYIFGKKHNWATSPLILNFFLAKNNYFFKAL